MNIWTFNSIAEVVKKESPFDLFNADFFAFRVHYGDTVEEAKILANGIIKILG